MEAKLNDASGNGAPARGLDAPRDIVVIGASAGRVEALKTVLAALPPDYDGTICVVLHIPPAVRSVLAHILGRSTRLVCVSAYDGAPVRPGVVYVAPPDWHVLLEGGRLRLVRGPRENGRRPGLDPLNSHAAVGSVPAGTASRGAWASASSASRPSSAYPMGTCRAARAARPVSPRRPAPTGPPRPSTAP